MGFFDDVVDTGKKYAGAVSPGLGGAVAAGSDPGSGGSQGALGAAALGLNPLIGGLVGNNLNGLLGGGPPTYAQAPIPPGLTSALEQRRALGYEPNSNPTEQVSALRGNAASALGLDPNQATNGALGRRAQRAFEQESGNLYQIAPTQAALNQQRRMGQALGYEQEMKNLQRGIVDKSNMAQIEQENARNQMLMSLFGGVGSGVGTALGRGSARRGGL